MKKPAFLLGLLSLTLPLAALAAAPAVPKTAPVTASVAKKTLPNGLTVLVWPRSTAPVVTTQLWYRVGSKDELPGATGLAHFLEHLLFKGTRKLKKGEVDRLTYQNGGTNNAFTFNDYTAYEFNFPKANWKVALTIEAERMRNATFDKAEFEAEREVVMEERRGQQDDPASRFGEQLNTLIFTAHPYRNPVIGWMEDLKRVTRDEVYAFYQKYYVPANATLVVTGDVTPQEAFTAVESAFAAVPKLPAPQRRGVVEPERVEGARHLRSYLDTQVPRLSIGFQIPKHGHPDLYPLWILDYILTEGNLSRLHRRLVDQDATAAEVSSYLGSFREGGELVLDANAKEGITPERLEPAVWDELNRLATEPVSAEELERARNQFYSQWVHGLETANELANVLGEAHSVGSYQQLDQVVPSMLKVTAADVQRVVRTYLARARSVTGYLYPRAAKEGKESKESKDSREGSGPLLTSTLPHLHTSTRTFQPTSTLPHFHTSTPAHPHTHTPTRPRTAARGPLARTSQRPTPNAQRPTTAIPFKTLSPVEKTLPNGLKLVLLENHDLPSVTFSARVDTGSYFDPAGKPGVANFVARMLDQGTRSRSYEQIQGALEQVGASFSAAARKETSSAHLQTLSRYAYDLLPLYAELITAPAFPEERLDLERSKLLTELRESADDAEYVARLAFNQAIYEGHPGAQPLLGTPESVRGLTAADLAAFHRQHFQPGHTVLAVVGDFSTAEMLEKLTTAFSGWQASSEQEAKLPEPRRQTDVRTRRITMPGKTQTQVLLGHLGIPRSNPDYTTLRVLDTVLGEGVGGGFTARIPYQLRDVQGLAYSVGSSITSTATYYPGVFIAAMGTAPEKEQAAVTGLLKEIARVRASGITEAELREAVSYLVNSYVFDFQTHEQLASYLLAVERYNLGYNYRRRFVEDVRKVSRADVLRVARQYLDPDHYTLVVVAPEGSPVPAPKE